MNSVTVVQLKQKRRFNKTKMKANDQKIFVIDSNFC